MCLLGALLLYVLSVGPFVWGIRRGYISEPMADALAKTVYYPLDWLYLNVDWCQAVFEWYLALWGVR